MSSTHPTNDEIRAWCLANGVPVNPQGSVCASACDAYLAAHLASKEA